MLTVLQDGGLERFDDLHVDRVDGAWRPRHQWIEGGLAAFGMATRLRNRHKLSVKIALAFSLQAHEGRVGVDFRTRDEFEKMLDWTPPSLYIVRSRIEDALAILKAVQQTDISDDAFVQELDFHPFGTLETGQRCLYAEFRRMGEPEDGRTVFLER